jgi:tellurite resistance protein TehA-like permease
VRRLGRALNALPEGAFTPVMATGIVALACTEVAPTASDALLWLAAIVLVAVAALIGVRRALTGPAGAWWDAATFVAATATVAAGLRSESYAAVANGLDIATLFGWVWIVARPAPWVARPDHASFEDASGRRLLTIVATQAAVIAAAALVRHGHEPLLGGATTAVWAMAVVLYAPMVAPVMRGLGARARAGAFRADDWICMGALAISALAASALLGMPGAPLRPEIRVVGLAVLAAAFLWVPTLVRLDLEARRDRHWPPGADRWSTVFPLGMFAAACQALGHSASVPAVVSVGRYATWVAVATWAVVAAGCAIRAASVARDGTTLASSATRTGA